MENPGSDIGGYSSDTRYRIIVCGFHYQLTFVIRSPIFFRPPFDSH
jgi:hypothetical protein